MTKQELLIWDAVPRATSYILRMKNITTGVSAEPVEIVDDTEYLYTFTEAGDYSWMITAKNTVESAASKRRTITVVNPLQSVNLVSPEDGAIIILEEEEPIVTPYSTYVLTPRHIEGNTYEADITVKQFYSVGAISLTLNYDNVIIVTEIVSNVNGMATNVLDQDPEDITGQLRAGWFASSASDTISLPDDSVLFTIKFELTNATITEPINFNWSTVNGECEYAGYGGTPIYSDASFNDLVWVI